MAALKNVYSRLIEKAKKSNNTEELSALTVKIGSACAVGLLTDAEQEELVISMSNTTTTE